MTSADDKIQALTLAVQKASISFTDFNIAASQTGTSMINIKDCWIDTTTSNNTNLWYTPATNYSYVSEPTEPPGRRPPPREFNRYINGSDLLEEFIRFAGAEGVRQGEVLGLPIELFLKWLIIRACEEDQEEPNVTLALPSRPAQPRCLGCQRYMPRTCPLPLHGERCAGFYFGRQHALVAA